MRPSCGPRGARRTGIRCSSTAASSPSSARPTPQRGAKPVVHAYARELVDVPVTDEGAFLDVDTPEDYERALALIAAIGLAASAIRNGRDRAACRLMPKCAGSRLAILKAEVQPVGGARALARLAEPGLYPHRPSTVQRLDTHTPACSSPATAPTR